MITTDRRGNLKGKTESAEVTSRKPAALPSAGALFNHTPHGQEKKGQKRDRAEISQWRGRGRARETKKAKHI